MIKRLPRRKICLKSIIFQKHTEAAGKLSATFRLKFGQVIFTVLSVMLPYEEKVITKIFSLIAVLISMLISVTVTVITIMLTVMSGGSDLVTGAVTLIFALVTVLMYNKLTKADLYLSP